MAALSTVAGNGRIILLLGTLVFLGEWLPSNLTPPGTKEELHFSISA
jgi:hypothetical protein